MSIGHAAGFKAGSDPKWNENRVRFRVNDRIGESRTSPGPDRCGRDKYGFGSRRNTVVFGETIKQKRTRKYDFYSDLHKLFQNENNVQTT